MSNKTHRAPLRYNIPDFFSSLLGHSEIGMTMRYVKIAEHYKVEAVEKMEKYRAVKMQEAEANLGMLQ